MAQLTLDFASSDDQIQLEKTSFRLAGDLEYIAVRGKTAGAYKCTGSFQWTPAVKAVCVLFLQALTRRHGNHPSRPTISGRRGSPASSLDYAIEKEPQWLCDMFGLDESGKTNLRRLFLRTNPRGKRPGPVSISLNGSLLPTTDIKVLVDSMPIHDPALFEVIIAALNDEFIQSVQARQLGFFDLPIVVAAKGKTGALAKRGIDTILHPDQTAASLFA